MDIPKQPTALVAFHCIFWLYSYHQPGIVDSQSPQCVVARSHHLCLTKNVSLFIHSWVGKKLKNHPVFFEQVSSKKMFFQKSSRDF